MTRRLLPLLIAVATAGAAAPAAGAAVPVDRAPGRIAFPVDDGRVLGTVDPAGLALGVAEPDGDVVLAGYDRPRRGIVLARVDARGALDGAFGDDGVARVAVPAQVGGFPIQVVRRAGGGHLVLTNGPAPTPRETPRLVLVATTADGRRDPAFGSGGVAAVGISAGCGGCEPVAVAPDGSILVAGQAGVVGDEEGGGPVRSTSRWVVTRLTPAGAVDRSFGDGGITVLSPEGGGGGSAVAVLPGGAVAVTGNLASGRPALARLLSDGRPDPAFAGGAPLPAPAPATFWTGLAARADGGVDWLGSGNGAAVLARVTAAGALDARFGEGGLVRLTTGRDIAALLPAPDGGAVVAGPAALPGEAPRAGVVATRVSPDGRALRTATVALPSGGGLATTFRRRGVPRATSLEQSGLRLGRPVGRPDGSLVVPGAVAAIRYTGEGIGVSVTRAMVAALTPELALDPAFGGPQAPARVRLRVVAQRARLAARPSSLRVALETTTSGPGLALVEVRAGGTVLARSTALVPGAGPQRVPAYLTAAGRRRLRTARRLPVTASVRFADLLGARASARARGTLR